jgi:hypothetical protein
MNRIFMMTSVSSFASRLPVGRVPTLAAVHQRTLIVTAVVVVAAAGVLGLLFPAGPHLGWATPFGMPTHVSYRGTEFFSDAPGSLTCEARPLTGLRRVGSVFGYFTSSRPILVPTSELGRGKIFEGSLFVKARPDCLATYITADQG